jgi:hypothetical protein
LPPYVNPCAYPWAKNIPYLIRTLGGYNDCV